MPHITYYRKWRPKTFDDVKGQNAIVTILKNQIKYNSIGHAYLFCGTRGTGKTSVAKVFAMAINCENPKDGSPCYECNTCKSLMGKSFDITEIDAASNNGVEFIRDLVSDVEYRPNIAKYKVYIIDEAHMLTNNAFNALLKTLEEPPEYVVFIFATTETNKILPTILSRCQRYDFLRIDVETISDRLKEVVKSEKILMNDKAIEYIAKISEGALRDALSILEQCASLKKDKEINLDDVLSLLGRDSYEAYHMIFNHIINFSAIEVDNSTKKLLSRGKTPFVFISEFADYIKNLILIQITRQPLDNLSDNELAVIISDTDKTSTDYLYSILKALLEIQDSIKLSDNKIMLLELGLIRLMLPRSSEDLSDMFSRLESVENRLDNLKFKREEPIKDCDNENKLDNVEEDFASLGLLSPTVEGVSNLDNDLAKVIAKWDDFVKFIEKLPLIYQALAKSDVNILDNKICIIPKNKIMHTVLEKRVNILNELLEEFYKRKIHYEIKYFHNEGTNYDVRKLINWNNIKEEE